MRSLNDGNESGRIKATVAEKYKANDLLISKFSSDDDDDDDNDYYFNGNKKALEYKENLRDELGKKLNENIQKSSIIDSDSSLLIVKEKFKESQKKRKAY